MSYVAGSRAEQQYLERDTASREPIQTLGPDETLSSDPYSLEKADWPDMVQGRWTTPESPLFVFLPGQGIHCIAVQAGLAAKETALHGFPREGYAMQVAEARHQFQQQLAANTETRMRYNNGVAEGHTRREGWIVSLPREQRDLRVEWDDGTITLLTEESQ